MSNLDTDQKTEVKIKKSSANDFTAKKGKIRFNQTVIISRITKITTILAFIVALVDVLRLFLQ